MPDPVTFDRVLEDIGGAATVPENPDHGLVSRLEIQFKPRSFSRPSKVMVGCHPKFLDRADFEIFLIGSGPKIRLEKLKND